MINCILCPPGSKYRNFAHSPGELLLADTVYYARNIYEMALAASIPFALTSSSCSPAAKSKLRSPLGLEEDEDGDVDGASFELDS